MWLRVLFVWWLCGECCEAHSSGEALAQLHGTRGRNRVLVCLLPGEGGGKVRSCAGALLHEQWAGVRAACLRAHPPHLMYVLRAADTRACNDFQHGYSNSDTRAVKAHLYHPWWDLAVVLLNRPYIQLDRHPNSTVWTASRVLKKHGVWKWLRKYIKAYGIARDTDYHYKRIGAEMISTRAPVFAFIFSILAPLLLLLLVSLYILNDLGSSYELPYKIFQYTKKPAQV